MIFSLIGITLLSGQCFPDRHNTSASAAWLSCEASPSPNPLRGESHWISYDLGELTSLGQMQLWNINNPAQLESGARRLAIDYSTDGTNWTEFQVIEVAAAEGSGFYEGIGALDFEELSARYLLLTIVENHGGDCYGLAEVKIETFGSVSTSDLAEDNSMNLYPSPATTYTQVAYESQRSEPASLSIVDLSGKELTSEKIQIKTGSNLYRLDLTQFVSGLYYVRLKSKSQEHRAELTIMNN